jgi:hypothetical protein
MGGVTGGKGAPAAPDFNAAAQAQAKSGHNNQTNAFGATSQWTQGPDGQWTQKASLGGPLGQAASGIEGAIANQDPNAIGHARDQSITSSYNQMTSRLDPQWSQAGEQNTAQLANQGLDPGSEAYENQQGNFDRAKNDAYASAANNAVQQGNLGTQTELASQNAPYQQLGELSGLTQQSQGPGETQFLPAAMAQYQGALQNYGIQQQGKNSALSGLGSLGGMVGGGIVGGPGGAMLGANLGSKL